MTAETIHLCLATDALTATVLDATGKVIAEASSPVETCAPESGWLEQRPEAWWEAASAAIADLRNHVQMDAVTDITVDAELVASVFLDGEREVIRPAILAGDPRGPHPILWLREHQPIAYKRVRHLLQPADYLRMRLTGEIATTPADAVRTGLFDMALGAWDTNACEALEINLELLPPVSQALPESP